MSDRVRWFDRVLEDLDGEQQLVHARHPRLDQPMRSLDLPCSWRSMTTITWRASAGQSGREDL